MLARRGVSPLDSGHVPFVIGLLIAAVWMSCAMFFSQLSGSWSWIATGAAVPSSCLGSFGGIQNCFGHLGGALAPALTGYAVQSTGSFTMPLLLGAAISPGGAALYWLVPRGRITADDLAAPLIAWQLHSRPSRLCFVRTWRPDT